MVVNLADLQPFSALFSSLAADRRQVYPQAYTDWMHHLIRHVMFYATDTDVEAAL